MDQSSASNELRNDTGRVEGDGTATSENLSYSRSGADKFPRAGDVEGCVLVPFALAACIPEQAVLKFAAKEPFAVKIDSFAGEYLVLYGGEHKNLLART
jgi:hypothetical protein